MPTEEKTKGRFEILDGVQEIVSNEMTKRQVYITDDVVNPELAEKGAVCAGHKACMMGSLVLAAGLVRFDEPNPDFDPDEDDGEPEFFVQFPALWPSERTTLMEDHPEMGAVYDAMNEASEEWVRAFEEQVQWRQSSGLPCERGWMEALFEAEEPRIGKPELLDIISRAREILSGES